MNTKILVCCHKEAELPSHPDYLPIQGGRKVAQRKLSMQGDDTGDNISELNPYFCELTAQYWAWKNLKGADAIGLCHYRRFLKLSGGCGATYKMQRAADKDISTRPVAAMLKEHDVILPRPVTTTKAIYDLFVPNVTTVQMQIFIRTFAKMHPECHSAFVDYLNQNKYIGCNMAIMPWQLFCRYNEFLFPILFSVMEHAKPMPYSYYRRAYGMFAEILLPVWCRASGLKAKHVPMILLMGRQRPRGVQAMLPKLASELANSTVCNLKYMVANRRRMTTYVHPFFDQWFEKDGISI